MTVEFFSFVAFLAYLVSEERCIYNCSSWQWTDGLRVSTYIVVLFYIYAQFPTAFSFVSLPSGFLIPHSLGSFFFPFLSV